MSLLSVAVFSGSSSGADPRFRIAAEELGRLLAKRGITLVCGGGRSGLMRAIAAATMEAGGQVVAVVPPTERYNLDSSGFTRVILVDDLAQRKATMAALADGFLALPGGSGTLEELMEQWTWAQIGLHSKPLAVLNVCGYFEPLVHMLENMRKFGFTKPQSLARIEVSDSAEDLLAHLDERTQHAPTK